MSTPTSSLQIQDRSIARKAVRGASLGFAIDCYDIYLPIIALAPAIAYFLPAGTSLADFALINGLIFAATLLGRPLGAVMFGNLADRSGRKKATVIAMLGSGIGTLVMAMIPGYEHIGLGSIASIIVLRFLTGIFLGGQYTGAVPLAMESAEPQKRGLYGGLISMGFPIAFCVISAITYTILALSGNSNDSTHNFYHQWGWRIPFLIGAIATLSFTLYYHRTVVEKPRESNAKSKEKSPFIQLFSGDNSRSLRQVFILMTGVWLLSNATSASFPGTLRSLEGMGDTRATFLIVLYQIALIIIYPLAGALSQKIGRRTFFIINGILGMLVAPIIYLIIISGSLQGDIAYLIMTIALVTCSICTFGCTGSYLSERFPASVRSSGYGVAYSVAIIIPAFYNIYENWLSAVMPLQYTTVALYIIGGLLVIIGALLGPETRHIDLRSERH